MNKILLTSKFATVGEQLLPLLPTSPNNLTVAFVDTAAQPYSDKPWLYEDRQRLTDMGFTVIDLDINGKTKDSLRQVLDSVDIIFVAGGNSSYLLQKTIESGFDELVKEYVSKGKIYVGSSAGSILAGPSTEPHWESEKEDLPSDFVMNNFTALQLVSFVMLPHCNKPVYEKEFTENLIPQFENRFDLRKLKDNEAIIIDGDQETFVSV